MGSAWRDLLNYAEFLRNAGNLYVEGPDGAVLDVNELIASAEKSAPKPPTPLAAAPVSSPTRTAKPIAPVPSPPITTPSRSAPAAIPINLLSGPSLSLEERTAKIADARARVAACTACDLCKTRTQTVYGSGNPMAKIVIVGEAPGEEEDKTGVPFVGRAGKLLTQMIEAIGFTRDDVFICNTLKCRPPGNRDPLPSEKDACRNFLIEQLSLLRPQFIVALGAHSGQYLTGKEVAIGQLRNAWHSYHGIPVLATYHPAFLLRSPSFKIKAWEDLQVILNRYNELNPNDIRKKWEKSA